MPPPETERIASDVALLRVPSGQSKRRAEQAREMGGAVWVLMMVLAIAGAVISGGVGEHHAETGP